MPTASSSETTRTQSDRHIPTLDGWRGIAILIVLTDHFLKGMLWLEKYVWLQAGQHGVTIFFVLSGYLITSRLLSENKIDLRRFYLRRFFRLMPSTWLYLLVLFLLNPLDHGNLLTTRDALSCLFFFRNYYSFSGSESKIAFSGHFWSLSIEEQFYIFWPCLLVLLGPRKILPLATLATLACAVYRFYHWNHYSNPSLLFSSEVRMDSLLTGCILALLLRHDGIRQWIARHAMLLFSVSLPLLIWHIVRFTLLTLIPLSESIVIAVLIASTSLAPTSLIGRVLEATWLKRIGVISYSLYVWQQIFLCPHWGPLAWLMVACVPCAAVANYMLVERPCIQAGRRLEKNLTSTGIEPKTQPI